MKVNERADKHKFLSEIVGILLLAVSAFLFVSLLTFDRYDHLLLSEFEAGSVHNAAGVVGALSASSLLWPLGLIAYAIPIACLVLAWRTFTKGVAKLGALEFSFFTIMLLSLSSLCSALRLLGATSKNVAIETSGGFVGLFLSELLARWLSPFDSVLLLSSLSLVCVLSLLHLSLDVSFKGVCRGLSSVGQYLSLLLPEKSTSHDNDCFVAKEIDEDSPSYAELSERAEGEGLCERPGGSLTSHGSAFLDPYHFPSLSLLDEVAPVSPSDACAEQKIMAAMIEQCLAKFNVAGKIVGVQPGPVVTMYEFEPEPGVKLSKIAGLTDDLMLALSARSVRILAPIPGRGLVGFELPNAERETISLRDVLDSDEFRRNGGHLPVALGKDTAGNIVTIDIVKMAHLLIAGSTGSGKSVSLNSFLLSLLYSSSPRDVRFILIDTKMLELSVYEGLPSLLLPIVTDSVWAAKALDWAVTEMRRRYKLMSDKGVRNVDGYNRKVSETIKDSSNNVMADKEGQETGHVHLPYIVIVIDEFANLIMVGGKKVEDAIVQLTQMARAAGIHLVLATQRPSVDIMTGSIKNNMPARISFKVPTRVDSRTVLDQMGAESLLGQGDMLFMSPETGTAKRVHGAFVSDEEVERVVGFLKSQGPPDYNMSIAESVFSNEGKELNSADQDELWGDALKVVAKTKYASISSLQRQLRIGYNRAARLLEHMEKEGLVSPGNESGRRREVFIERFPVE